ncbi:MAG: TIGR02206 family membrane protein [Armatimonadetes bacterium]|nr:TIGR02206 family membrane protein [Armatimonadota bacterium]
MAAVFLASYFLAVLVLRVGTTGFDWDDTLPLHLCDLVVFFAIDALASARRLSCELTYYWAMSGTLQALITPDLHQGFPSLYYLLFFLGHGANIVAVAVLLSSTGYRPSARGVAEAFVGLLLYVMVVGALDDVFGWNYGYLCRAPSRASLVDLLGAWPDYIVSGLGLGIVLFVLLYLPWARVGRAEAP